MSAIMSLTYMNYNLKLFSVLVTCKLNKVVGPRTAKFSKNKNS